MKASVDRLAVVTGTSSGIGLAVARTLLQRNWRVVGIARRHGEINHPLYSHMHLDLEHTTSIASTMDEHLGGLMSDPAITRFGLVNNAALGALLGPVDRMDMAELTKVFAVNVTAPVTLMSWVVRLCNPGAALRIVNVSSGAAVSAFAGMSAYCSSKAALRMAGMVLAAEFDAAATRADQPRDASVLSYEPGMVDTPMQTAARVSSPDVLPMVDFFKQAAADGRLVAPELPARDIADYLDADGHQRFTERRHGVA